MADVIRYASGQSSLGPFVAALSERGLAMVEFGGVQEGVMRARFPDTDLVEDPAALQATLGRLGELIEHPARDCDFALDLRGSAFELKVWNALREISGRNDGNLRRDCSPRRIAARGPRGGRGVCRQSAGGRRAVSPDREKGWLDFGVSLGRPTQAGAA